MFAERRLLLCVENTFVLLIELINLSVVAFDNINHVLTLSESGSTGQAQDSSNLSIDVAECATGINVFILSSGGGMHKTVRKKVVRPWCTRKQRQEWLHEHTFLENPF